MLRIDIFIYSCEWILLGGTGCESWGIKSHPCTTWSSTLFLSYRLKMARGQQKLQSQAKAAEKLAKQKKQQGHNANTQKKAAQAALVHVCSVCKVCITHFISGSYMYRWDY